MEQYFVVFIFGLVFFQSLIEAHDKVAAKSYELSNAMGNSNSLSPNSLMPVDAVRMIGIQKKAGEPLVSLRGLFISCIFFF